MSMDIHFDSSVTAKIRTYENIQQSNRNQIHIYVEFTIFFLITRA